MAKSPRPRPEIRHGPLRRALPLASLILIAGLWAARIGAGGEAAAAAQTSGRGVAGHIVDSHGEPIRDADLRLFANDSPKALVETRTGPDGAYLLVLPDSHVVSNLWIEVERPHFKTLVWRPDPAEMSILLAPGSFLIHDITLQRQVNFSFWIATLCFAGMLLAVAFERLHSALAALLAMAVIFTVSLVGGSLNRDLIIFNFDQALEFVDFDVIFLLLGMMIVIGVIEETGIFQWLAFQAYRLSRGRVWLLALILMLITFAIAALLDNVITMLLITPITLEIALVLGINPLALLVPALLSANVGGVATLVGTPVNIMIGSYARLSFNDFLAHLTPGVLLAELGLVGYCLLLYRKEHHGKHRKPSAALLRRLQANSQIDDLPKARKALIVFGGLLLLFIFGDAVHLTPAVAAIIGAVAMLVWVHPDIEQMMGVVDWTTLIFFIALFMVIGAVQEVGLIALATDAISGAVGGNLLLAVIVVIWASALLSAAVDNIPLTAAMLPVAGYLSRAIPGAGGPLLFFALAVGANLGGNGLLVGSSANLVVAGIAERAGYPLSFRRFFEIGFPAMLITTAIGSVWVLVHFR